MVARLGSVVGIRVGCGVIGATAGAILGAVAALPFCFVISIAPFAGIAVGGVAGFVAGAVGVSFSGPTRFRTGGVIGAFLSLLTWPYMAMLWGIPLILALVVGYFFGGYLDDQMKLEKPRFAIAQVVKDMIEEVASSR
ncbi:MAG TPA: hypothetical protein VFW40_06665 [Capsulimonadaceae bacterium]|nr:hypothetical protein [Capsulimonadaceae bacterium]